MRPGWKIGICGVVFSYFAACAPVKFEKAPEPPCGGNGLACVQKCTGSSCIKSYSIEKVVGNPLVDILVVDDNSGSMSINQGRMATAFNGFIQNLDSALLDYRIAITTTDISNKYSQTGVGYNAPGPYNGYGALQDGELIGFGNGAKFLTNQEPARNSLFVNTVKRPETEHCEQSGYTECPSNDERAIYAANLVLDRTAGDFFRPAAHLAVIILANEDERGLSHAPSSGASSNDQDLMKAYPIEEFDKPETFISKFKAQYPAKTTSVHSIIVVPGDSACLSSQSDPSRYIYAREGWSYQRLSQLTKGEVTSICESNYANNLKKISDNIQKQALSLPFSCRPIGNQYKVSFTPQPAQAISTTPDWSTMQLTINTVLTPGTKVTLSYDCSVQ